ncbi:hypothetical protein [Kribbella sp. CA-294648]|uniref:hypothetical protein n=1 Tax=Kribbella sp. CA-294648 TaxID=3239948 RepID=UPI003D8AE097
MGSESRDYKGHRIELASREELDAVHEEGLELRIDGEPVRYGRMPSGRYFMHDYAYDWTDDLFDLAERRIDYEAEAAKVRRGRVG